MEQTDYIFGSGQADTAPSHAGAAVFSVSPDGQPSGGSFEDGEARVEQTTPMTSLACWIMDRYRENSDFRKSSGVDEKLAYCLRAQTCTFSDAQREEMRKYFGAEVCERLFTPVTSTKNRAAKAMLVDLVNQSGDPLFHIEPTPYPDVPRKVTQEAVAGVLADLKAFFSQLAESGVTQLPEGVMRTLVGMVRDATDRRYDDISNAKDEYARDRAKRMERKVWDILDEGGFKLAFKEFIDDVCCKGTGIMVGPVDRVVPVNRCRETKGGAVRYSRGYENRVCFERVDPMDCYPSPDAKRVEDGVLCIRVKYTADSLARLSRSEGDSAPDGKGWIRGIVRDVISRHPRGGVKLRIDQYDPGRRYCERNGTEDVNDCTFEGVRCFASVRGRELAEMGIVSDRNGKAIDREDFYRIEAVVIENRVVYCRIYDDALGVPVSKGTFYSLPNSWWGESIADKLGQCQTVLNNCVISLMKNMPACSGAIYYIKDFQRLVNKSPEATRLKSGMTIPFNGSTSGDGGAPIGAITVQSAANELLAVFNAFVKQADIDSGIPAYSEGQSAGASGALRTASGLATLTEASTRGFKMVMTSIDDDVISRVARLTADYVLVHDADQSLKGDVSVRSVGLIGRILKAQRDQARMQLFNMIVTNPNLLQMFGPTGVIELLRPSVQDVDINPDDVMPSKGRLKEMEELAKIRQLFEATSAAQGVMENSAPAAGGEGAPPGVAQPPAVQGGVAERRNVA